MRASLFLVVLACALSACSYTRPIEHPDPLVSQPSFYVPLDTQQRVEDKVDREFYTHRLY